MNKPRSFEHAWRERFSGYAEHYDDDASIAGWSKTGLAARFRQFQRAFSPNIAGERWLDAGCGAGTYSRYLARLGAWVLGVDYSFRTLQKASAHRTPGVAFCNGDATALPVHPGAFEGVLCFGVTQALSSSDRLVTALAQCVRPGGQVWVDALNARCVVHLVSETRRRLRGEPPHLRYETPGNLKRLLRNHGFSDIRLFWLPILPGRLQRLQTWVEARPARRVLQALSPVGALLSHSFLLCASRPHNKQEAA